MPMPRDPPARIATRCSRVHDSLRASTTSGLYFPAAGLSTHERPMTQAHAIAAGGAFLSTPVSEDYVFVPEDLTEEQRMFGRTAAEFMHKEVLPVADRLYETRLGADAPVAEESERSGPAASRDSAGVRRPRARSDQRLVCRRADRRQPVVRRVARRAHVHRHAAARLLRHRRAEAAVSAAALGRRPDRRLRAHRAAVGL